MKTNWSLLGHPVGKRLLRTVVLAAIAPALVLTLALIVSVATGRPWIALSVALVATLGGLGYVLSRLFRVAHTLETMLLAMRGIRVRQIPPPLPVESNNELREVVESFNEMSRELGEEFAARGMLSSIDRTILAGTDVEEVMKGVVRGLRLVAPCEAIVVALFDGSGRDAMQVYLLRFPNNRTTFQRGRLAVDHGLRQRIPEHPITGWKEELPIPERVAARLRADETIHSYTVVPVSGLRENAGVVVLCHTQPVEIAPDFLQRASDLASRLDIAFSSAENNKRLRKLAHSDALTGLPNRHALLTLLTNELEHARRKKTKVAVMFLDLDRFKQVNDTLGHAAGDALLQSAAERIRNSVRDDDTVARHGGDEFTIVLSNLATPNDAGSVARQLIRSLSRAFEIEGKLAYVGASAGISIFPDDGQEPADLLKKADTAMYRAKEEGRSRFAYFEEKMNVEVQRRAALDGELRQAFEKGEFVLHYQPQFDLRTGRIFSVEALIRWNHPERGLLYPDAFVPFAEESGLIDAIGGWVLKEACLQHQTWRTNGVPIPRVAVNASIRQMRRSNFVRTVQGAISRAEMPRDSLEIEVTETMFLQGDKATQMAIDALARMGVRFAIDDFGTGYSSFSYLKTVPASVLKLDRSFIADAALDHDAGAIVEAMINMARILRKEVVAEGVETEEQLDFLRSLGCERVQGFYFSKALPAEEIAAFALETSTSDIREFRRAAHVES